MKKDEFYDTTLNEYLKTVNELKENLNINSQEDIDSLRDYLNDLRDDTQDKINDMSEEEQEDSTDRDLLVDIKDAIDEAIGKIEKTEFTSEKETKKTIVAILEEMKI